MFEIKEKKINRKQFHYLLTKFLFEKRLAKRFYDSSIQYKLKSIEQGRAYSEIYKKYNFSLDDTFSEHIYKCIDVYTQECFMGRFYGGSIYGFFRLLPSTFDKDYYPFWHKIALEWQKMTKHIKFDYGND
jgi:hypothetical protein